MYGAYIRIHVFFTLYKGTMDIAESAELLWTEAREGRWFPEALRGKLTLDEALRLQLAVRDRKLAAGAKQAGWKVGLTSQRVRDRYGTDARPFGHIMAGDVYPSGAEIPLADFSGAAIEPELCFLFGQRLAGPGATPASARAAVAGVAAGFELNQNRAQGVTDFPLTVADNLSQWGLMTGDELAPLPPDVDLGLLEVVLRRNGEEAARTLGNADTIDDHFLSLSILANTLAGHGEAVEAGSRVITGSFAKFEVAAGERWEAEFSGIGSIAVSFTQGMEG